VRVEETEHGFVLSNAALQASLAHDGSLLSLIHRETAREALSGTGNRLVLFDDRPTEYEAWDIDPFALETGRETGESGECGTVRRSALRTEIRFTRHIGAKSRMTQVVRLDAGATKLEFDCEIDWQERRKLLKVAFPLAPMAPRAAYETMFGAVERPTHANTDADLAQYEVPGHRWADLSEPGFGVSLLTDSRYGYATFGSTMTLSLLRGSESPDRGADLGVHRLRYALFPHAGDWRAAGTVGEATRFNRPLLWARGTPDHILATSFVSSDNPAVVIDTVKPGEDGGLVVRLYESHGAAARAHITFNTRVHAVEISNTLEDRGRPVPIDNWESCLLTLRPFQIVTLKVVG
jgi:alpha-mannosidase